MAKRRDSGIELMRILAMLMVVGFHATIYGEYYKGALSAGGWVGISAEALRIFFAPCVNMFVIITGYFMARSPFDLRKTCKRALSFYLVIFFYSVVLSTITLIMGKSFYTIDGNTDNPIDIVIRMIFPVSSSQWYFFTSYLFLCLLAPFVNIVLQKLTKKQYLFLIGVLGFILSVWLTLSKIDALDNWVRSSYYNELREGKSVFWFLFIYILGGYIGLHSKQRRSPAFRYLAAAAGCFALGILLLALPNDILDYKSIYISYVNPLIVLFAVFMLMFFKDLHFHSRIINLLGSSTVGIYAIHEFRYMRKPIWDIFGFKSFDFPGTVYSLLMLAAMTVSLFLLCAAADLVRQQIFRLAEYIFGSVKGKFKNNSET